MPVMSLLKNLLFTENEAKVYLSLLKNSPATSYAIAKNADVPRSKIYEVLDNMIKRGDVLVSPGNPQFYRALSPKSLIASRKEQAERNFAAAEELLGKFTPNDKDDHDIWNITGRDSIIQKIKECINAANKRILLEIWTEDFKEVEDELKNASMRGVDIVIVSYGEITANFAKVYSHDMSEQILEEHGGRWIIFSVDDSQVIAGTVAFKGKERVAWTMHIGLVVPITEIIIHDLYIIELLNAHRETLEKTFGKNLVNLREKFSIYPNYKKLYDVEGAINETSTNSKNDE